MGWPTGLEPATTRTTIWSSTIELRPPTQRQILVFRFTIATGMRFDVARSPLINLGGVPH